MNKRRRIIAIAALAASIVIMVGLFDLCLVMRHQSQAAQDGAVAINDGELAIIAKLMDMPDLKRIARGHVFAQIDEPFVTVSIRIDADSAVMRQLSATGWWDGRLAPQGEVVVPIDIPDFVKPSWWQVSPPQSGDRVYYEKLANEGDNAYRILVLRSNDHTTSLYYVRQTSNTRLPVGFIPMMRSFPQRSMSFPSQMEVYEVSWITHAGTAVQPATKERQGREWNNQR